MPFVTVPIVAALAWRTAKRIVYWLYTILDTFVEHEQSDKNDKKIG